MCKAVSKTGFTGWTSDEPERSSVLEMFPALPQGAGAPVGMEKWYLQGYLRVHLPLQVLPCICCLPSCLGRYLSLARVKGGLSPAPLESVVSFSSSQAEAALRQMKAAAFLSLHVTKVNTVSGSSSTLKLRVNAVLSQKTQTIDQFE